MAGQVTNRPSFDPPQTFKKARLWAERTIPDNYTDGDARHWPGAGLYKPSSDTFYLCVLGQKWAEKDGIAQPGVQYYIDKLPDGYAMFEQPQPGGPQTYRRLFGHPTGRFYDSAERFGPHFLWLMSGMEGECTCIFCAKKSNKPVVTHRPRAPREVVDRTASRTNRSLPQDVLGGSEGKTSSRDSSAGQGIANKRAQRQVRQSGAPLAVDEEGTEDIYKDCIKKLENTRDGKRGVEIDLTEDGSIDWIADRQSLPQYLTQIEQQHCFVPRIGELVLWIPSFLDEHYLMIDPTTSEYKFYSFEQQRFHGFPAWRGGIITAVPSASVKNGPIDFTDILSNPSKKTAFNTAGFRIETMPDPNDDLNKAMSKEYRYVPLRNIRPLAQWQLLTKGIPRNKLHVSIEHGLTCMTSLSLLEKWRFNGSWPNAHIFCKGVYLGSELITVGDTIRILPGSGKHDLQPDVLVVDSIRYVLQDIKPEHAHSDSQHLCSKSHIVFVGSAYVDNVTKVAMSQNNANLPQVLPSPVKTSDVKTIFRCVGAEAYGPWYPWHGPRQKYEVSHDRVLGRLYEADAVRLWTGQRQAASTQSKLEKPFLGFDTDSVMAARLYATATDARLPEPKSPGRDINWHISDNRAEALALATINGIDVGKYHDIRTPLTLKSWRVQVKIADGQQLPQEAVDNPFIKDLTTIQFYTGKRRGRPVGAKLVDGKIVLPEQYRDENENDDDVLAKGRSKPTSQMAGAALVSDEDTSEEEFDSDLEDDVLESGLADFGMNRNARIVPQTKPTLSKADIMASIEIPDDESLDDDISELEKWSKHPPPARGGTEESEGGDYRE